MSSPQKGSLYRYSFAEIKRATDDFHFRNLIGKGGEAKVYKGVVYNPRKKSTVKVAVKRLDPWSLAFENEIETLPKLCHPNILSLLGYCRDSSERILVFEYMENGNLADNLYKNGFRKSPLSWEQRLQVCIGAARGLEYLHGGASFAQVIIHRDIKPSNILLGENLAAKISDFGLFKMARHNHTSHSMSITRVRGSYGYFAPEYVELKQVTRKIDVYAFGVVLFEVLCKKSPWMRDESYYMDDVGDSGLGQWARCNTDPDLEGTIAKQSLEVFVDVVENCLKKDPKSRPTMKDVADALERAMDLQKSFTENVKRTKFLTASEGPNAVNGEEEVHLPGTEDRAVLYYTSIRAIKKTFVESKEARELVRGMGVLVDERDVALEPVYGKELAVALKGMRPGVPQLFVRGKHVGGADEIRKLNETGKLEELLEGLPKRDPWLVCEHCGDARFVSCPNPNCGKCNQNGLIRCSACFPESSPV